MIKAVTVTDITFKMEERVTLRKAICQAKESLAKILANLKSKRQVIATMEKYINKFLLVSRPINEGRKIKGTSLEQIAKPIFAADNLIFFLAKKKTESNRKKITKASK